MSPLSFGPIFRPCGIVHCPLPLVPISRSAGLRIVHCSVPLAQHLQFWCYALVILLETRNSKRETCFNCLSRAD